MHVMLGKTRIFSEFCRVFVVFLLLILTVLLLPPSTHAQQSGEFITKARNALLMDFETGSVLYQKAADDLVPPASMSKLMTIAVLFKALKDGKVRPDEEFLMSENAWRKGGAPSGTSAMFVPINTKARIDELIQGIIVQSGNDACIAVAEGMAGTEAAFAKKMEDEARRLGLKKSTFRNATGLDDPEHLMTARELAILAKHLISDYPGQYSSFSQKEFEYRKHKFYNRNPLLGAELGVDGLKTGHTQIAGYGIVFSALSEGRRLIGVVMGLADEKERKEEARRLLEWGIKAFAKMKLFNAGEEVGSARVWGGSAWYVPLVGKDDADLEVVLPRFPASQKLKGEIVYQGPLKSPIKKGDQVALLRVSSSATVGGTATALSEVPLYAGADIEPASFLWKGFDSLLFMGFRAVQDRASGVSTPEATTETPASQAPNTADSPVPGTASTGATKNSVVKTVPQ
jgi:serine-type D-Ala-D-Ala carboxypeptidase (penicillin-binding protein 5/6)